MRELAILMGLMKLRGVPSSVVLPSLTY